MPISSYMAKRSFFKNPEFQFLSIVAALVCLLGVPALSSVLSEPALEESMDMAAPRSPASVGDSVVEVKSEADLRNPSMNVAKSVTVAWECNSNKSVDAEGTHLRLTGSLCNDFSAGSLQVKNQTNGYTASVIMIDPESFTTDFIELQAGENTFEISGLDKKGQTIVKQFTVKKRVPASL